jgi:glycosyltransferase involved in cell wall biosynthesis
MIKVTALTSGDNVPSSRFRVRQFIQPLSHFGIQVSEHPLVVRKYTPRSVPPLRSVADVVKAVARLPGVLASRSSDITWLERELIPERFTLERFAGRKQVFDVDDAIWLNSDSKFADEIASKSIGVIAGNHFLAQHFERVAAKVWVVPTSIDTDVWKPLRRDKNDSWVIGWIGTSSNLPALVALEEPLADFLAQNPGSKLHVVCDRNPQFQKIPAASWSFACWSAASEVRQLQQMDVGLMPLPDTEWARGKCAFKMISYMAAGIPVVASPIGVNKELLQQAEVGLPAVTIDDWYEALCLLFQDRTRGAELGAAGRRLAEERYSVRTNVGLLAGIFKEVMGL